MWIYAGNKFAKFHGNILTLSENIAKSSRGLLFLTHTVIAAHYSFIDPERMKGLAGLVG